MNGSQRSRTLRERHQGGRCWAHISRPYGDPLVVRIHARNDDRHAPGTSEAQDIGFLGGRGLLGWAWEGVGPAGGPRRVCSHRLQRPAPAEGSPRQCSLLHGVGSARCQRR